MLYDYDFQKQAAPYYSDIKNTPEYKAWYGHWRKKQKQYNTSKTSVGILHGIGSALLNFFGGPIGGAAAAGIGEGEKALYRKGAKDLNKFSSDAFNPVESAFKRQLPGSYPYDITPPTFGNPDTALFDATGNIGSNLGAGLASSMSTQEKTVEMPVQNPSFNYTPEASPSGQSGTTPVEINSSTNNVNWNTDFGSGGYSQAPQYQQNSGEENWGASFRNGGMFVINEAGQFVPNPNKKGSYLLYEKGGLYEDGGAVTVEGGKGKDDIALVDTTTGQDTGVRVSKGEKLVVSEENITALQKALKKKDHKKVFKIMESQMKQTPNDGADGEKGYLPGGLIKDSDGKEIVFEEDFEMPKTWEGIRSRFDYIQKVLGKGGFSSIFKGTNLKADSPKEYEKAVKKLNEEYVRLAPLAAKAGSGTGKVSDEVLSKFSYQSGDIKDGEKLKGSQVLQNNYSNAEDAVYKNGQWYHTQGDNKGNPIDSKLQKELTMEYGKKASGVKYGVGAPEVNIVASKEKPWSMPTTTEKEVAAPDEQNFETSYKPFGMQLLDSQQGAGFNPQIPAFPAAQQPAAPTAQAPSTWSADVQNQSGYDWAGMLREQIPNLGGTIYDAFRINEGWKGANEQLPVFSKSGSWMDYMGRMKDLSGMGLSAPEMNRLQTDADRTYAYDVANIYNVGGGNAGAVLGNLGRAANSKYRNENSIAALDRQARNQNLLMYGNALGNDINLDRTIFTDAYNNTLRNKEAGAQLMSDGIKNMGEREITDRFYGPLSAYSKYMNSVQRKTDMDNQVKGNLAEYVRRNGFSPNYGTNYNF